MDDPVLTLAFNALFLLLVPLIIGLASSTLLRATLLSAFAIYLYPALTFSWEMINRISTGAGPPEWPHVVNEMRVMFGSAVVGASMGLLFYCLKRLVQRIWRAMRPCREPGLPHAALLAQIGNFEAALFSRSLQREHA